MQALNGSLVALVTPLHENGDVDYDALYSLIDWHIDKGTNGIVSVGTTGESATLRLQEHLDVVEATVKHVNKRLPVISGTGANSTEEAIELSKESKLIGADYALSVTPYYNKPTQKGLIAHYTKIAESADIKQILYNVPSRTVCDILPETVEILSQHNNIIGIKEALDDSSRIKMLVQISKNNNDFLIFSGDDPTFLQSLNIGAHGVISVSANVVPETISKICKYIRNKQLEEAKNIKIYIDCYLLNLTQLQLNGFLTKWV